MALPETISVRRVEEDAGYVAMSPVVTQTFRLAELMDLVVSVAGKDVHRVRHTLAAGAIFYHGFHYSWSGTAAEEAEIAALLSVFPDDDPSRPFDPALATWAILETGGGTQQTLQEIPRDAARSKALFSRHSPWEILLQLAGQFPARYEKYDYAKRGDLFRVSLRFEEAQNLLRRLNEAAPRKLRLAWRGLHPPAAVLFVSPREPASQGSAS